MKKHERENLIYEDFIHDRQVKMFKDPQGDYAVYVQVFTTDNLPFSPLDGGLERIFFNYDEASTADVTAKGVDGDAFNETTQKYEVTDHTFVVGELKKQDQITDNHAIDQMKDAAESIIAELSKRVMPPHMVMPHILTDVQRAEQLLTDRNVKITKLSKKTGIPTFTLYNYRKNPESLKKASHANIQKLMRAFYDTYFSRNEVERFRFMLINTVNAYLQDCKNDPVMYNSVFELYMMCQKGDWHRLAKMEELWKASYSAEKHF